MPGPSYVEGFAIVSEDGMLANAHGVMPDALKFEADKTFFEDGMDGVDVAVHGRHSHEGQPHSPTRPRLILTRQVVNIERDPINPLARYWNPAGLSLEDALENLGCPNARLGVIGGPEVFGHFLPLYDAFHLTRAPGVWLPGGRPVFPMVPAETPEAVLVAAGLKPDPTQTLDAAKNLTLTTWRR
jgi:dihydrofolate reductase